MKTLYQQIAWAWENHRTLVICALLLTGSLIAQFNGQWFPVWADQAKRHMWVRLGPGLTIANDLLTVTVPQGPPGPTGPQGLPGPQGLGVNRLYNVPLTCDYVARRCVLPPGGAQQIHVHNEVVIGGWHAFPGVDYEFLREGGETVLAMRGENWDPAARVWINHDQ